MKLQQFLAEGEARWRELDGLRRRAGSRAERLRAEEVRRLAELYRQASADLAYARSRYPGDPVVDRLEAVVVSTRGLVYERPGSRTSIIDFFRTTYWLLLRQRGSLMGLAALALLVPGLAGFVWSTVDPEAVESLLPPGFLWVTDAESTDMGLGAPGLLGFSSFVMVNNIRVTLTAFVLGVTWGLGTAWVVLQNGLILGGLTGLAVGAGNTRLLLAAVGAHGLLELSCIVVGAGSGFALARAILRPGEGTRREALAREARSAAMIAVGTVPWLVLAGLLEGFGSRTGLDAPAASAIGLLFGGGFWVLVAWRGSEPRRPLGA